MGVDKKPGMVDYLFKQVKFEDIIRSTQTNSLRFITSGTLPLNSAELLESKIMLNFLKGLRDFFDVVIIDTAPIVAVIDSEILARLVDGIILVISSEKTEKRLMMDAIDIIKHNKAPIWEQYLINLSIRMVMAIIINIIITIQNPTGGNQEKNKSGS